MGMTRVIPIFFILMELHRGRVPCHFHLGIPAADSLFRDIVEDKASARETLCHYGDQLFHSIMGEIVQPPAASSTTQACG